MKHPTVEVQARWPLPLPVPLKMNGLQVQWKVRATTVTTTVTPSVVLQTLSRVRVLFPLQTQGKRTPLVARPRTLVTLSMRTG